MSAMISQIESDIQRILQLIPPDEHPQEYLRALLDARLGSLASETSMGLVAPAPHTPVQTLASARMAVEMLEHPEQLSARPEGIVDLGTIEWQLRPALRLDGSNCFTPLPSGEWRDLAGDVVALQARSVCRIDLGIKDQGFFHVGTGFLVGTREDRLVVMTNAHVVEFALRNGWPISSAVTLACDFERFSVDTGGLEHKVSEEYFIHSHYDLALLFLPAVQLDEDNLPPALGVSSRPFEDVGILRIGIVGHPSFNAQVDPFPRFFGFGNEFGVKRFSPGYIRAMQTRHWRNAQVEVIVHDATTLSGSSGSCILELDTMKVVGLHFGGWPTPGRSVQVTGEDVWATLFSANGAVPLWTLSNDPQLKDVAFV